MKDHRGHIDREDRDLPDSFGAAGSLVLGWLVWLRAWLAGATLATLARRAGPEVVDGCPRLTVSRDWADTDGFVEAYGNYHRQAYKARRVRAAMWERKCSQKVIMAKWRSVCRVFTTFACDRRGDGVLPRAHMRPPEGGCGPPYIRQSSVLPPYPRASKRGP